MLAALLQLRAEHVGRGLQAPEIFFRGKPYRKKRPFHGKTKGKAWDRTHVWERLGAPAPPAAKLQAKRRARPAARARARPKAKARVRHAAQVQQTVSPNAAATPVVLGQEWSFAGGRGCTVEPRGLAGAERE